MTTVHHRYATVKGQRLFYREAGPPSAPAAVLLHGFPASSFMFRNLIPLLAGPTTSPVNARRRIHTQPKGTFK
jgi:pimeloyl-ACP methyl ester carboxylesterase